MMKTLKKTLASIFLMALLFANISITVDNTSFSLGNVLATLAFGGGSEVEEGGGGPHPCFYNAYQCNGVPYGACQDYWRCNPNGPCLDADGIDPYQSGIC